MCNETNNKSYGSGLTSTNKLRKSILYILDNIIFFVTMIIQYTADHGSRIQPPNSKAVSCNPPLLVYAAYFTSIYLYAIN